MNSVKEYFSASRVVSYGAYQRYCVDNDLAVLSYAEFSSYAQSIALMRTSKNIAHRISEPSRCGSCGGGKVK